ncbi:MAG: family 16 glycosylhydrolase [Aquirufa sp.]
MKYISYILLFISFFLLSFQEKSTQSKKKKDYTFSQKPIWSDEFNQGTKPDLAKWSYDLGAGGWGNNELQYYTSGANASIQNGILSITAKKESIESGTFSSARLVTKGKGDWLYGRFEARIRVPKGRGTWPAFWMLPTDQVYGNWPNSGEIDIMEHVGYDPNVVHCTVHTGAFNHTKGTQVGVKKQVATADSEFHVYRVDWTPDYIQGFIDDELFYSFKNDSQDASHWPFNKRFHLILNLAVGGNWGGAKGVDESVFPLTYDIDYVRVYELLR